MAAKIIIDISNHQSGHIDNILVAAKRAGVVGVIAKISEGTTYTDPTAHHIVSVARGLGFKVGGYHFARFESEADARAEAHHFVQAAHAAGLWRKGDIRPVLDYEVGPTNHASPWRDAFAQEVSKTAHGAHTILYTGPSFNKWLQKTPVKPKGLGLPGTLDRRLWVASYGVKKPQVPSGYSRADVWLHQYTDKYPLAGQLVDASKVQGLVPALTLKRNLCASNA